MDKEILGVLEDLTDICKGMADELYRKSGYTDASFNVFSNSLKEVSDRIEKLKKNIK
jgi:predicted translin family RNA/ssDNA-binding protein